MPLIVNRLDFFDLPVYFSKVLFMTDPRYKKLAELLVNYSTELTKGDRILLDMIDVPDEFTIELIRAVRAAGATPFVETRHTRVGREQLLGVSDTQAAAVRDMEMFRMKKMQAYIAVRGSANASETADVAADTASTDNSLRFDMFPRPQDSGSARPRPVRRYLNPKNRFRRTRIKFVTDLWFYLRWPWSLSGN